LKNESTTLKFEKQNCDMFHASVTGKFCLKQVTTVQQARPGTFITVQQTRPGTGTAV